MKLTEGTIIMGGAFSFLKHPKEMIGPIVQELKAWPDNSDDLDDVVYRVSQRYDGLRIPRA